jgi:hypothetical protein
MKLVNGNIVYIQSPPILRKYRNHLKILGARKVTWSKVYSGDPLTLEASVRNLIAMATWRVGFMHLWRERLFCC